MSTETAHRPYSIRELPASPDGSRFHRPTTPDGWSVGGPTDTLAFIAQRLIEEQTAATPDALPDRVELTLYFPAKIDNEWKLVTRGTGPIERIPQKKNQRPTKFARTKLKGGALIDSFLLGEEAWSKCRDAEVFNALLAYCVETNPSQPATRKLADQIALAIALRAGLVLHVAELGLPDHLLDKSRGTL